MKKYAIAVALACALFAVVVTCANGAVVKTQENPNLAFALPKAPVFTTGVWEANSLATVVVHLEKGAELTAIERDRSTNGLMQVVRLQRKKMPAWGDNRVEWYLQSFPEEFDWWLNFDVINTRDIYWESSQTGYTPRSFTIKYTVNGEKREVRFYDNDHLWRANDGNTVTKVLAIAVVTP